MGLGSQNLTATEKNIFRKIVKKADATPGGKRLLNRTLGRISKSEVKKNSTVSKNIAAKVSKLIIDPFRKKNPIL